MQRGDIDEYKCLAGPRRRSLRQDKQQWMEQVASAGENHLMCGEIKDAFSAFQQLRQKCATSSAPLKDLNGKLLSPPDALVSEAIASIPDPSIDICPRTTMETYRAMNKIKPGKAPGVCGIYPEYTTWWKRCTTFTAQNIHTGLGRGGGSRGMAPRHNYSAV